MRRLVGVGLSGLLAVMVAACGDDNGDEADEAADAPTEEAGGEEITESEAGGPVTIEHRYGETTLEETPERIVSLDTQWTDVLTALDGRVVGAGVFVEAGGEPYPWQDLGDDVELIPATDAIPYEAVAGLDPDLIVITYGAVEEADYEQLSEIAPTIPLLGDADVDPWEDIAVAAGEILGVPEAAAELVTEAEQRAADLGDELPGLEGKSIAFANYVPGDALYVLTDENDGANVFFSQLGLEIDPELVEQSGDTGRLELSLENVDQLDAEVLLLLAHDADPADITGYDQLPAVQTGSAMVVDMATAVALNTPTPLSLPYALEQIRPTLEASAAG